MDEESKAPGHHHFAKDPQLIVELGLELRLLLTIKAINSKIHRPFWFGFVGILNQLFVKLV